jgi:hypothetical protein
MWTAQDKAFSQFCEHDVHLSLDDLERRLQDLRHNDEVDLALDPLPVTRALRQEVDKLRQDHEQVQQLLMDLKHTKRSAPTGMRNRNVHWGHLGFIIQYCSRVCLLSFISHLFHLTVRISCASNFSV